MSIPNPQSFDPPRFAGFVDTFFPGGDDLQGQHSSSRVRGTGQCPVEPKESCQPDSLGTWAGQGSEHDR